MSVFALGDPKQDAGYRLLDLSNDAEVQKFDIRSIRGCQLGFDTQYSAFSLACHRKRQIQYVSVPCAVQAYAPHSATN